MPEQRKKQMNSAIKLTVLFLALYALVTQQVLANTWIRRVDEWIYERDFLLIITPGKTPTLVMLVDDLGLRGRDCNNFVIYRSFNQSKV